MDTKETSERWYSYLEWLKTWEKAPEGANTDDGKATPWASLQWKGTDACLDFHCVCGSHLHFDDEFLYNVRCLDCNRLYSLSQTIEVREVPPEHVILVEDCRPKEARHGP